MNSKSLNALPPINEIFENAITIGEAIDEKINNNELSSEEVDRYIDDLEEIIQKMEALKASIKKKASKK